MAGTPPPTFQHRCIRCGTTGPVRRSRAVTCPVCAAEPGAACLDLRYTDGVRTRVNDHEQRVALIRGTDVTE